MELDPSQNVSSVQLKNHKVLDQYLVDNPFYFEEWPKEINFSDNAKTLKHFDSKNNPLLTFMPLFCIYSIHSHID